MKCSNCGAENDNMAVFCRSCGSKLEASVPNAGQTRRFCASCGAELQGSSRFCEHCGAPTNANGMQGAGFAGGGYVPHRNTAGSEFGKKLKNAFVGTFRDPEGYIKVASQNANYFPVTLLLLGAGSLLSGVAFWLYMQSMINSAYEAFGSSTGYTVSVGWLFFEFILTFVVVFMDMVCVHFSCKVFGGQGNFQCRIGAMAPEAITFSGAMIVIFLFMCVGTVGKILSMIVLLGGSALAGGILPWKTLEITSGLKSPKNIYAFAVGRAALGVVFVIIYAIVMKTALSGSLNMLM